MNRWRFISRLFVIILIKRTLCESRLEIQPFLVEILQFTFRSNDFFFFKKSTRFTNESIEKSTAFNLTLMQVYCNFLRVTERMKIGVRCDLCD